MFRAVLPVGVNFRNEDVSLKSRGALPLGNLDGGAERRLRLALLAVRRAGQQFAMQPDPNVCVLRVRPVTAYGHRCNVVGQTPLYQIRFTSCRQLDPFVARKR